MKVGFFGLLTLLLIGLKLTGYIAISWWLVFLPMIISLIFYTLLFILIGWSKMEEQKLDKYIRDFKKDKWK